MAAYPGYDAYGAGPYAGYASYAAPAYGAGVNPYDPADELRTVFITGFPNDVKERELNNLLRFLPGYEASQMNWKNGQVCAGFLCEPAGCLQMGCNVVF